MHRAAVLGSSYFFCLGFLFEAFVCFLFPDFDVFEVPDYTGLFPNTLHCVTCSTLHDWSPYGLDKRLLWIIWNCVMSVGHSTLVVVMSRLCKRFVHLYVVFCLTQTCLSFRYFSHNTFRPSIHCKLINMHLWALNSWTLNLNHFVSVLFLHFIFSKMLSTQ